jgi:hypothetical protein
MVMESIGNALDFFARNRTRIGLFFAAAWGAVHMLPVVQTFLTANPWVDVLIIAVAAGTTAAGLFKSDGYQRDVQGKN